MKRTKEAQKEMRSLEKQISAMTKRQSELMFLFKRLYEDNILGRIPDEQSTGSYPPSTPQSRKASKPPFQIWSPIYRS